MSKVWNYYGTEDPYYGVLSIPEFRAGRMDAEAKARFFASGVRDVDGYLDLAQQTFGPLRFGTALDYGCGVGRLSRRLVDRFEAVISVDISEGMLKLAREHLARRNATFENASRMRSSPTDFILSQMVFQHIAPSEGIHILPRLAARLRGTGIIEIPIRDKATPARKVLRQLRRASKSVIGGRPIIPMYAYDQLTAVEALKSQGCEVRVIRFDTPMFENARLVFCR